MNRRMLCGGASIAQQEDSMGREPDDQTHGVHPSGAAGMAVPRQRRGGKQRRRRVVDPCTSCRGRLLDPIELPWVRRKCERGGGGGVSAGTAGFAAGEVAQRTKKPVDWIHGRMMRGRVLRTQRAEVAITTRAGSTTNASFEIKTF